MSTNKNTHSKSDTLLPPGDKRGASTLYPLHGIVTVLNTPYNPDGSVDYKAVNCNVKEALRAGVAGFLVPAIASEVSKLTLFEKLKIVETVFDANNGQVPVFVGTGGDSAEDAVEMLNIYQAIGVKNVLIQLPYSNDKQFKEDFKKVADLIPEVVMLQDWDFSGYGLSDELILELFESEPKFRCLKIETVPAGVKYSRILEITNDTLNISGGWAVTLMIEGLKRGVHAFMPTGMHWIYTEIFNLFQAGKTEEATELFNEILPILAFSNQHLDISIHFFKRLLWKQGIFPTPDVRKPILPFDKIHEETADIHIKKIMEIENRIRKNRK